MKLALLALETSSARCGVALLRETGRGVEVLSLEHEGAQEHAERLLPMARDLLAEAGLTPQDLNAVAFGQGPGGFTGLRVACGVAQGIAMAQDIPVVPVVSHLAVAAQVPARPDQAVVVALDARMAEVYLAVYRRAQGAADDTAWEVLQAPILISAAEAVPWIEGHLDAWRAATGLALTPVLAGDAWAVYPQAMTPRADWTRYDAMRPDVREVARLARQGWMRGEAVPAEQAMPLYVRDKVAYTTAERQQGQGGNPKAIPALDRQPQPRQGPAAPMQSGADASAALAAGQPASMKVAPNAEARSVPLKAAPIAKVRSAPLKAAPIAEAQPALLEMAPIAEAYLDEMERIEASVQAFPWTRRNFADAIEAGYDGCLLRREGHLLGFCILMHAPDVAHLLVIAIDKAVHRQGLGSRLMRWCEQRARQHGIDGLLLEVRPSNRSAVAFYEHHGFRQVGLRRGYYPADKGRREDALVMQKAITLTLEEAGNGRGG
jgi:tRNA threonylcarbamoyladenosine biosynthesis protein TsaB